MALVLRKAVLPKNLTLLKCFKGRPLASAANKKNPATLTTAVPCRSLRDQARVLSAETTKIQTKQQLPSVLFSRGMDRIACLRFCMSCPNFEFVPESRTSHCASPQFISPPKTRPIYHDMLNSRNAFMPTRSLSSPNLVQSSQFHTSCGYGKGACPCGCPCPFPCGPCGCPQGCNCLPPPCNTPPKCIQYMTGYYYYPYGFWFCGPYHVTGTCTPVGPCGPCPPASCPCPCPKCCACLNPVAASVVGAGPQSIPRPIKPKSKPKPPPSSPCSDLKFSIPQYDQSQYSAAQQNRTSAGISKFFPFNAVPSVEAMKGLPHATVMMYPSCINENTMKAPDYKPPKFPEYKPVYCTPSLKQSKTNYSNRPRQPLTYNYQKPKKSAPNSLSKSNSDGYEKRSESRSPIHHKRCKKFVCDVCPVLESPRGLKSPEQRDKPMVTPGAFDYSHIPNFRSPFAQTCRNSSFRAYDSSCRS